MEHLRRVDFANAAAIVLPGGDIQGGGRADTDARTLLAYLVLQRHLAGRKGGPNVLMELLDEQNASLFDDAEAEVRITPVILSHMLAQIALRRELGEVFDDLFGPGESEVHLLSADRYGLAGLRVRFADVRHAADAREEVVLGVYLGARGKKAAAALDLNPGDEREWTLSEADDAVVLSTSSDGVGEPDDGAMAQDGSVRIGADRS